MPRNFRWVRRERMAAKGTPGRGMGAPSQQTLSIRNKHIACLETLLNFNNPVDSKTSWQESWKILIYDTQVRHLLTEDASLLSSACTPTFNLLSSYCGASFTYSLIFAYLLQCRDIISALFKVADLRKHGVTLHLSLHSERQPVQVDKLLLSRITKYIMMPRHTDNQS